MTVAKGGSRLKPAAPADGPQWIRPHGMRQPEDDQGYPAFQPGYPNITTVIHNGVARLAGRMVTTEDLLQILRVQLGGASRLENATGLTDKYDLKLEYAFERRGPSATASDTASDPAPDLFTTLEKQLGLKLEKIKIPAVVVIIDHLNQQPADN